jgi:hypothetical protein
MKALPPEYPSLPAREKQKLLWNNILQSEHPNDRLPASSYARFMWNAFTGGLFGKRFLTKTLLHHDDELPDGRPRLIHPYGSICLITFEAIPGAPYSGTLSSGACGLLRVSLTLPSSSFTPGFAVKFLIDGKPSQNICCIPSINGQNEDQNVFLRTGSNRHSTTVHGLDCTFLAYMFGRAARSLKPKKFRWNYLPLDHFSATRSDGTAEANPVVPHELIFLPTAAAQMSRESAVDYRLRLKEIAPGTEIYHVLASDNPTSRPVLIGGLRTASAFVASRYGDETIFFQHDPGPR